MKNFISILIVTGISIFGAFIVASYFIADYKQNTIVQSMTETIRSSAFKNIDNVSRIYEDELFLSESNFEADFLGTITSKKEKALVHGNYQFEYLKKPSGSIKAIRVKMTDSKGEKYQASCIVDISES